MNQMSENSSTTADRLSNHINKLQESTRLSSAAISQGAHGPVQALRADPSQKLIPATLSSQKSRLLANNYSTKNKGAKE